MIILLASLWLLAGCAKDTPTAPGPDGPSGQGSGDTPVVEAPGDTLTLATMDFFEVCDGRLYVYDSSNIMYRPVVGYEAKPAPVADDAVRIHLVFYYTGEFASGLLGESDWEEGKDGIWVEDIREEKITADGDAGTFRSKLVTYHKEGAYLVKQHPLNTVIEYWPYTLTGGGTYEFTEDIVYRTDAAGYKHAILHDNFVEDRKLMAFDRGMMNDTKCSNIPVSIVGPELVEEWCPPDLVFLNIEDGTVEKNPLPHIIREDWIVNTGRDTFPGSRWVLLHRTGAYYAQDRFYQVRYDADDLRDLRGDLDWRAGHGGFELADPLPTPVCHEAPLF